MLQTNWHPTFNQDGRTVEHIDVQNERFQYYQKELITKREKFEKALSDKCLLENEVYNKLPYHKPVDGPIYQVGLVVYAMVANHNGVHPVQIGIIQ